MDIMENKSSPSFLHSFTPFLAARMDGNENPHHSHSYILQFDIDDKCGMIRKNKGKALRANGLHFFGWDDDSGNE